MKAHIANNTYLDEVFSALQKCFAKLSCKISEKNLDALSQIINDSMSHPNRYFHNSKHAIEIADADSPLVSLAGLFHDIVYLQVDGGLPKSLVSTLDPYITILSSEAAKINDDFISKDPSLEIILDIFAASPGDTLMFNKGLNEFLSSLSAHLLLKDILNLTQLMQIHLCIEATIPFRIDEISHAEQLEQRAHYCIDKYGLKINQLEFDQFITNAIDLANRDVKNFATRDTSWFLATTWLLLPERVPSLRGEKYTFSDYRQGMCKMRDFFVFLKPSYIFKRYKNFPSLESYELQTLRASRNIELARDYLQIKIIAIALLEAIAQTTGGDLPIENLLGKVKTTAQEGQRMEDHLSKVNPRHILNPSLFSLLSDGRALETHFDLRNSPLAAFLYAHLSQPEIQKLDQRCHDFFESLISAEELLYLFPSGLAVEIIESCAIVSPSRRNRLLKLSKLLKSAPQKVS